MSYENFVMNTMRNQFTPRTYAEAYRTAEYACAIYEFKTENKRALERITGYLYLGMLSASVALILFGCTQWLK